MKTILLVVVGVGSLGCVASGLKKAAYDPHVKADDFVTTVDNPFLPLVPGTTYKIIETKDGRSSENVIEVTNETKTILGVKCIVVHDTLTHDGVLEEDTLDWFAQDRAGNVWYFGEQTKEFKANGKNSTEGSWEGGVDGAQPGISMPANPKPGDPYRQEYKFHEAEDMGQVIAVDQAVTTPAGSYTGCVETKEWSLLEAGHENKWYCRGIGVVKTESTDGEVALLQSISPVPK